MSLSVCLLARNEENYIGRAIESVAGAADEVIVADTGSTDRTVEIAAGLGARVVHFQWNDDFSAGRNFTIARAACDWILWLNPDEELLDRSHSAIRACLAGKDMFGYYVVLQNLIEENRPDYFMETVDLRLFRRRPGACYIGRAHPHFDPATVQAIEREGLKVAHVPITLRSVACRRKRTETKLRWIARVLELELRDRPGQLHYLIEYGRTLLLLGDPAGDQVLAEAADQVWEARHQFKAPVVKVQALLEHVLKTAPAAERCRLSRDVACELALRWFPSSPPLLFQCANLLFHQGQFVQAVDLLERLVKFGRTGGYDRSRRFDPGLIHEDALVNLAVCYRRLGKLINAQKCYRQLIGSRHFHSQAIEGLAATSAMLASPSAAS